MKTGIIVQARMTSTRLPGKVLKPVLDKPLLQYQIERLRRVRFTDEIIIATTENDTDDPIVEFCKRFAVPFFRGSEEDVLSRYYWAAKSYNLDVIVRITSDCPLIDPEIVDKVIGFYLEHAKQYDYVSNTLKRTYPRGMDTEVFSMKALSEAYNEAVIQVDREHVTPFIYRHPERYKLENVSYFEDQSRHRWTVDTPEDFELIKRIIEALYPADSMFSLKDVLGLLVQNPEWVRINEHIEQKK